MIFWYILFVMMVSVGFLCYIGSLGSWRNFQRVGEALLVIGAGGLIAAGIIQAATFAAKCNDAGGIVVNFRCVQAPAHILVL